MPIVTERNISKYVDDSDIRIYKKSNINPTFGKGIYLPKREGFGVYLPREGEGFLDALLGIGKTVINNIDAIKNVAQAAGEVGNAGYQIAKAVKTSKEAHETSGRASKDSTTKKDEELMTDAEFSKLMSGKKKGSGFRITRAKPE
jgi:hypothetical protein